MKFRPPVDRIRWLECRHASGEQAPGFALVRVVGVDGDGTLQVAQPDTDGQSVLVLGPAGVPAGGRGLCTADFPAWALYEAGDGSATFGQSWGAGAGSWKLRKDKAGFRVLGGAASGRVIVNLDLPPAGAGGGVTSINALMGDLTFATGSDGTDFNVATSGGNTITYHLPAASITNRGAVTPGPLVQEFGGLKSFFNGLCLPHEETVIADGAINAEDVSHVVIDTENAESFDELTWIEAGHAGQLLFLRITDDARTVKIKHAAGNMVLFDAQDIWLTSVTRVVMLVFDGVVWRGGLLVGELPVVPTPDIDPTECGVNATPLPGNPIGSATNFTTIYTAAYYSSFVYLKETAGGSWSRINCDGLSMSLSGLDGIYWLYLHHSSGTPVLTAEQWSGTPAADNVRVDGILMNAGDQKKRLLAAFATSAPGQCTSNGTQRLLVQANAKNRTRKVIYRTAANTSWTPGTSWGFANGDPGNWVRVLGLPPGAAIASAQMVWLEAYGLVMVESDFNMSKELNQLSVGIGINSSAVNSAFTHPGFTDYDPIYNTSTPGNSVARLSHFPGAGINQYNWLEVSYPSSGAALLSFGSGYHDFTGGLLGWAEV